MKKQLKIFLNFSCFFWLQELFLLRGPTTALKKKVLHLYLTV